MKLTRVELTGFKSFATSVGIAVEHGITAIVGPNGCGKSNISDAVRWVLGEQRARLLRGTRMDDLIFQGSVKRRPINIAEVSLVFDNSDGALPIAFHEVVVTRRLSRNGQSDYLLNQSPVRLRDLQDLIRGTGLGSDAGVVIEAQMIDRLLSDRAEERRSLFEEAAGIGFYRDRKSSTERRLENTGDDLHRLDDLIAEIQAQVRSLARQRGKALRHEKYSAQRFAIVMTLARRELALSEETHGALSSRGEVLRARLPEARQALTDFERGRETRVQERATAVARRTELERQLAETRIDLGRLEGDLSLTKERLENAATRKARALEERTHTEARAAQADRELEAAASERHAAEEARTSVQMELDLRTTTEEEARDRLNAQRAAVRDVEESLQGQAEHLRSLTGERAALDHELEELRLQESQTEERLAEAERGYESMQKQRDAVRATLAARERDEHEATTELERARHTLAAAREHEAATRIERREVEESIAQLAARRDALEELERKREGLAPAVRALLSVRDQFGDGAVLGPLSDFLTSPASDARVAERLLGDWLQAVLVEDPNTVEAVRQWHAHEQPGPLLLLPVNPGPAHQPTGKAPPIGLDVSAPAATWLKVLLAGSHSQDAEGSAIVRANGAVYLPGSETSGPLSRRADLDALAQQLDDGERRLAKLMQAAAAAGQAHADAERAHESATEKNAAARAALHEAQAASDDASRQMLRADRERSETRQARERSKERIAERQSKLLQVSADLHAGEEERARLAEHLNAQRSALADLEAAQEAARERRVHWQVEEAQVVAREEAASEREGRAQAALDEAREEIERLEREVTQIEESTRALTERRGQWTDTLAERRVKAQQLEAAAEDAERSVDRAEEALLAQEATVQDARRELERVNEEAHRSELELTEAEARRRSLIDRIEGEWHKSIGELLNEAPEVEGETEALHAEMERLTRELERIGPVNPLAVQEHTDEVERLEFLESQREDLVSARATLLRALREIDQTARAMFLETFAAVRENFKSVFRTLFEGGDCDVRLADESDPLTSPIEIHAAPRGKRPQRIHLLSSGERALVAISLLFSIYLTKPAPFCLLDEVDAPLDDANVMRFVRLLEEFKADTQFIVITHNPRTMQVADAVFGVTMQEPGVSTIVGVRLGEVSSATT